MSQASHSATAVESTRERRAHVATTARLRHCWRDLVRVRVRVRVRGSNPNQARVRLRLLGLRLGLGLGLGFLLAGPCACRQHAQSTPKRRAAQLPPHLVRVRDRV
eukprot:scaffold102916_cov32-Phaeocystis_antarctica.AAC.1